MKNKLRKVYLLMRVKEIPQENQKLLKKRVLEMKSAAALHFAQLLTHPTKQS